MFCMFQSTSPLLSLDYQQGFEAQKPTCSDPRTACTSALPGWPSVPLEKATDYEVKLDTMAAHPDTTQVHHLATPFILNFRTKNRNKLGLVLSYPQAGDSTIGIKPNFMLVFDKKISTSNLTSSNIAKYIVVKDQNGNTIKTNTRLTNNSAPGAYGSIYFDLTGNMTANTNYTLTLAPEITDISGQF